MLRNLLDGVALMSVAVLVSFSINLLTSRNSQPKPLEVQIDDSLRQLQEDSKRSSKLMEKFQSEIIQRQAAIKETEIDLQHLQEERSALELTAPQKQAIQYLIRRPQTAKEILTSKEFWLGKVLVSTIFLILGIVAGRFMKRSD